MTQTEPTNRYILKVDVEMAGPEGSAGIAYALYQNDVLIEAYQAHFAGEPIPGSAFHLPANPLIAELHICTLALEALAKRGLQEVVLQTADLGMHSFFTFKHKCSGPLLRPKTKYLHALAEQQRVTSAYVAFDPNEPVCQMARESLQSSTLHPEMIRA